MTAKEMFKKLGYECEKTNERIRFINEEKRYFIIFDIEEENYTIGCKNWLNDIYVDIKLQNAINKQIEELGWENDN